MKKIFKYILLLLLIIVVVRVYVYFLTKVDREKRENTSNAINTEQNTVK